MKTFTPQDKPVNVNDGTAIAILDEKGNPVFYVIINSTRTKQEARNIADCISLAMEIAMNTSRKPDEIIQFSNLILKVLSINL